MTAMTTSAGQGTKPRSLFRVVVALYQQIAALFATFALIASVSHFVDFEWRGFILTLIGQWNEYVRPAIKWLTNLLITIPLGWLGWRIEVPLPVQDYLVLCLVNGLSFGSLPG